MSGPPWWQHQCGPTARFLGQELFHANSPLGLVCTPTTVLALYISLLGYLLFIDVTALVEKRKGEVDLKLLLC